MTDVNSLPSADPKWRRLPEERPVQILTAAIEIFAEHGIAAAKLEDIAARAGVSKGTIYLYFESKEELFREVVRQILVPRVAEAEQVSADASALTQIERYLRTSWTHFEHPGGPGWVRMVITELRKHPDLLQFYYDEVVRKSNAVLGAVIERGIARGELRPVDPVAAVRMIKSLLLMHVLWADMQPFKNQPADAARTARDAVIEEILDFVTHALRPEAPASGLSTPPSR